MELVVLRWLVNVITVATRNLALLSRVSEGLGNFRKLCPSVHSLRVAAIAQLATTPGVCSIDAFAMVQLDALWILKTGCDTVCLTMQGSVCEDIPHWCGPIRNSTIRRCVSSLPST